MFICYYLKFFQSFQLFSAKLSAKYMFKTKIKINNGDVLNLNNMDRKYLTKIVKFE